METINNQLGNLFCRYWNNVTIPPTIKEVCELLESGSDPNMGYCMFEKWYEDSQLQGTLYKAEQLGYSNVPRSRPALTTFKGFMLPLIVAALYSDNGMIQTLGEHGARLNSLSLGRFAEEQYLDNPFKAIVRHGWDDTGAPSPMVENSGLRTEMSVTQTNQEEGKKLLQTLLRYTDLDTERVRHWVRQCFVWTLDLYSEELTKMFISHGSRLEGHERPFKGTRITDLPRGFLLYLFREPELQSTLWFRDHPLVSTILAEDDDLYHILMEKPHVMQHYNHDFHDDRGCTMLHLSIGNTDARFCQLLSERLKVDAADKKGNTVLHHAAYYGHTEALAHLLWKGADPNRKNSRLPATCSLEGYRDLPSFEWTPMHIAAYRGFGAIVSKLFDGGADNSLVDCVGLTPLDVAMEHDQKGLSFELVERGFPFSSGTVHASRLLEQAYSECRYDVVDRLIRDGAKTSISHTFANGISTTLRSVLAWQTLPRERINVHTETLKTDTDSRTFCDTCAKAIATRIKRVNQACELPISPCTRPQKCQLDRLLEDAAQDMLSGLSYVQPVYMHLEFAKDQRSEILFLYNKHGSRSAHAVGRVPNTWDRLLIDIETYPDDNTDSDSAFTVAAAWLHNCLNGHGHCNMNRQQKFTPTRLVDLGDIKTVNNPRLVTTRPVDEPYVALSHLWGREGLPTTTLSNLNDHSQVIAMDTLSETIKDAMHIVKRLGLRYLWIDALCIVQDSKEDWLAEATKMGSVYSGALFTLAVADSLQHSEGIFRPRKARCLRPFRIDRFKDVPHRDREIFDGEGEFYVFPNTSQTHSGARPKGPLDTRGWTLQEQLLSPRILYYGNGELFWDCLTVSASESSPISTSLLNDENPTETWALKLLRKSIAGSTDTQLLRQRLADVWKEFIQNYSARKLTLISDKIVAMEGILNAVSGIINDAPIAGLWRTGLWSQLLWYKDRSSNRERTDRTHQVFPAPSWSWLGSEQPVRYQNTLHESKARERHDFTDLQPRVNIDDIRIVEAPGQVGLGGQITTKGPFFRYHLTRDDLHRPPVWKRWNRSKLKINPGRWMLDFDLKTPQDVWCMVMAEDEVAKLMVCLCVLPDDADDSGDGPWKRIGICHWEGLLHEVVAGNGAIEKRITIV